MRHAALFLFLYLSLMLPLATPALAQDQGPDQNTDQGQNRDTQIRDGFDLFSEGARMMLDGLRDEMEPILNDIQPFLQDEMLPFFQSLVDEIDDLSAYQLPERLPNGDIIIRRKPDAAPLGEIDPSTDL